jgi:tetratricopeptide (TPR) repeat protein
MPRRSLSSAAVLSVLAVLAVLCCLPEPALAQGGEGGARELALGQEAYARQDYRGAVGHLSRAIAVLGSEEKRQDLAAAYFQLGLAYLVGLADPQGAMTAFLSSAELDRSPANAFLWAALAAEKLGQPEAAERFKGRALEPVRSAPAGDEAATPPAAPEKAAPAEDSEKVDAFQYFFGKKRQEKKDAAPPTHEPPTAEPPRR